MLNRYVSVGFLLVILSAGSLPSTPPASAETLVESHVDSRVALALRVRQEELQGWLPAPWNVNPIAAGPSKEANLLIFFIDKLLTQDAEGKPIAGGIERSAALLIPAKHQQTGETAPFVIRIFTASPSAVPGPYKNSVHAAVRREHTEKGTSLEAGIGSDSWDVRDAGGGIIELLIQYQRAVHSRAKAEAKVRSAVEPSFFRIYRFDQGGDVVKSIPAGINRVQSYQLRVTVPELRKLFDGTEQLVSITLLPWYVRQVFLP